MKRSLVITQSASITLDLGRIKVQSSEKLITITVENRDIVVLDYAAIEIIGPRNTARPSGDSVLDQELTGCPNERLISWS